MIQVPATTDEVIGISRSRTYVHMHHMLASRQHSTAHPAAAAVRTTQHMTLQQLYPGSEPCFGLLAGAPAGIHPAKLALNIPRNNFTYYASEAHWWATPH